VTAAQNVHTLVMGRKHGVRIFHNLLYGFPDDELSEYQRIAELIPRLVHLDPPVTCLPVQIMRWAPLQTNPEHFGIDAAEHDLSYDMIFSKSYCDKTGFDLDDLCYLFERNFENAPALQRTYDRIQEAVAYWREVCSSSWLFSEEDESGLIIHDKRIADEKVYRLEADAAKVLKGCEGVTSVGMLEAAHPYIDDLADILDRLQVLGLIFRDELRIVSLVVHGNGLSGVPSHTPTRVSERAMPEPVEA
jgi:hypothetical protein